MYSQQCWKSDIIKISMIQNLQISLAESNMLVCCLLQHTNVLVPNFCLCKSQLTLTLPGFHIFDNSEIVFMSLYPPLELIEQVA